MDFVIERTKDASKTSVFEEKAKRLIAQANPRLLYELGLDESRPNANPTQQLCEGTIVSAKGGLSDVLNYEDLFAQDDAIQRPGASTTEITDLNEGKLPKDMWFLLYAIQLQFASGIDGTSGTEIEDAAWNVIPAKMYNGTFELQQNGRVIVPEISMEKFHDLIDCRVTSDPDTAPAGGAIAYTNTDYGLGIFGLDNPKMLYPDERLEAMLRFGAALTDNDAIKITLHGIRTSRIG